MSRVLAANERFGVTSDRVDPRRVAVEVAHIADCVSSGARVVEIAAAAWSAGLSAMVARRLEISGFAILGPAEASRRGWPDRTRHAAMICTCDDDRAHAVRALRGSVEGHHRALVVVAKAMDGRSTEGAAECAEDYGMRIEMCLREGDLASAERVMSAAVAEVVLTRARLPAFVRGQLVELRFWQGRTFEVLARARSLEPATIGELGWRGLAAWISGNRAVHAACAARLAVRARTRPRAGPWAAMLSVLLERSDDRAAQSRRLVELDRVCREAGTPAPVAALAAAVAAEAWLAAGEASRALSVLRSTGGGAGGLEGLLCEWLACCATGRDRDGIAVRIARAGAAVIREWGRGRTTMECVGGLPSLIRVIEDAPDEVAMLGAGCAWIRRHAGATKIGVMDSANGVWIASDGFDRTDAPEMAALAVGGGTARDAMAAGLIARITSPVRYAGSTIAHVVAQGPAPEAATIEPAVQALAALAGPAARARLDALDLARDVHRLAPEILGRSPAVAAMRDAIGRAATTNFPTLIEGESGTGKELVARALHRLSARRGRRFAAVNCAALTDELVEAELFGHTRGAFTGAIGARAGLFEEAHGGSLFLDEVGELSARAQAKLLRVLQEREIRRVGENLPRAVDVRIISATNVPLGEAAARGAFREDLLFRLAVVRIRVPPLRDRIEDVPLLALAFWRQVAAETGKRVLLGADALSALCRHSWPGNVRELQNVIAGLAVLAPARGRLGGRHVQQVIGEARSDREGDALPLDAARRVFERRLITAALARHGGRRSAAALELGLSRQGLTKALRRLGLASRPQEAGVA